MIMAVTKAQELYFERVKKIRSEMTRIERELDARRRIGPSGSLYLLPWGAALMGLTAAPTWQLVAALGLAHGQLLVAQDAVRLTVWAAPVLVAVAAKAIPQAWWALALLVTAIQRDDRV